VKLNRKNNKYYKRMLIAFLVKIIIEFKAQLPPSISDGLVSRTPEVKKWI
jgi:hypothetical protein